MKILYLHIGWRKTGSSAIQSFVTRQLTNGRLGDICLVPLGLVKQSLVTGDAPMAHHRLARFDNVERWSQLWDRVAVFVRSVADQRFLISTETFSNNFVTHPRLIKSLVSRLDVFDRVVVVCWIRRQDEFIASMRIQSGKHGASGISRDRILARPDADYNAVLTKLQRLAPDSEIRVNLYRSGNDVIRDFLRTVELSEDVAKGYQPHRINASVSPQMFKLQILVNKVGKVNKNIIGHSHQSLLLKAWDAFPEHMKRPPAVPITIQDREAILDNYRESNVSLCRTFGLDPAFFNPTRSELESLPNYNLDQELEGSFLSMMRSAVQARTEEDGEVVQQLLSVMSEIECYAV